MHHPWAYWGVGGGFWVQTTKMNPWLS